jgi:hypothetical protein
MPAGIYTPVNRPLATLRTLLYGLSGSAKTPLLTRLPARMKPALYIAADPTSKKCESIMDEDLGDLLVYVPDGAPHMYGTRKPIDEAKAIARAGWETWDEQTKAILGAEVWAQAKALWPGGLKTIILDTCTHLTEQYRTWVIEHEKPSKGGDMDPRHSYGRAQDELQMLFTVMENVHPEMHILWGAQMGDNGEDGSKKIRGPQTVGSKGPLILPHRFTITAHISRMKDPVTNPKGHVRVQLTPEHPYVGTVKTFKLLEKPEWFIANEHAAAEEFWNYCLDVNKSLVKEVAK